MFSSESSRISMTCWDLDGPLEVVRADLAGPALPAAAFDDAAGMFVDGWTRNQISRDQAK